MDTKDKEQLAYLCRAYGDFEVLKTLTEINNVECESTYADNPGAVIHRLRPVLNNALQQARGTHILYQKSARD